MDQNLSIIFFLAAVFIVGGLLFAVIALAKKGPRNLDVEKYRSRWLSIEQQLKRDEISSYHMCILNADKLVDQALVERGVNGKTMAERMKEAKGKWSNAHHVWTAHKLRNQIAHEPDVNISYESARRALIAYKQALKDLGAI
jgi:transposase